MQNDLQSVADKLLELKASIAPQEAEIEKLSDLMRAATTTAGEPLRFASSLGMVETRQGSVKQSKGVHPVFHVEQFKKLPPETQAQLRLAGVVTDEEEFSQARKPSVSIKPTKPAPAANENEKVAA